MAYNKTNKLHPCQGRTPTRWLFLYFCQQAGAGYLKRYTYKESWALLENLGITDYKIVESDAALKIAHTWLSIFCSHRTSFKGIRGGKTYLWDEIHSKYQSEAAKEKYSSHFAPSYYAIADNFGEFEKQIFVTRIKPIENPRLQDFHVFPKNYAWSMAYTHEDGWIGPKFFMNPNYVKLNKANEKAMFEISRAHV